MKIEKYKYLLSNFKTINFSLYMKNSVAIIPVGIVNNQ